MCEPKATGIMPGFLVGRGQRTQAQAECKCHQKPARTLTQKAETALVVVGGIVLLASMNWILHALVIALASVLAVLVAAAAVLAVRRSRPARSRRALVPAPRQAIAARTTVTSVTVNAIGQGARPVLRGVTDPHGREAASFRRADGPPRHRKEGTA